MAHQPNFMGREFFWWMGVVEENDDSKAIDGLYLGRCRVRILGIHSPFLKEDDAEGEGIDVDQLHWAYPMMPVTSAGIDGMGITPLGIVKGSWVFGFSRDGEASQDLIIMGSFGGFQFEQGNPEAEGFKDPDEIYPRYLGEESTNRLATNKERHPMLDTKEESVVTGVPIALDGSWDQPEIQYETKYPFNKVMETEHCPDGECTDYGHVQEWDDTPGKERMTRFHKAGTYEDLYPNADRTMRIMNNNHVIAEGNHHYYAKGDITITAGGNIKILGEANVDIEAGLMINMVAGQAINMSAPIINMVSKHNTITTGGWLGDASGFVDWTTAIFNARTPVTNLTGMANVYKTMSSLSVSTASADIAVANVSVLNVGTCNGCG